MFTLPLRPWERHFTVVQWDHRGTGKTLGRIGKVGSGEMPSIAGSPTPSSSLTSCEITCVRTRSILLAESMGTLTGLPLVKQRPDLFYALVVTDLFVDVARNEAQKYQMTLERLRAADNTKAAEALERIGGDPTKWDLSAWNTNMALAFGTNLPTPNLDRKLLFPLALSSRSIPSAIFTTS